MRHRSILLAASVLAIAACSADKAVGVATSGSVSFSYTGAGGGSYNATGSIASNASATTARTTTWAAGWKGTSDGGTYVAANLVRTNVSDVTAITIARQTTGTSAVDSTCVSSTTKACTDVLLMLGVSSGSGLNFICMLTTGSVTIASISATNVQGSFSGSGTCSETVSPFATSAWVVTNGSFNVPIVPTPPAGTT